MLIKLGDDGAVIHPAYVRAISPIYSSDGSEGPKWHFAIYVEGIPDNNLPVTSHDMNKLIEARNRVISLWEAATK